MQRNTIAEAASTGPPIRSSGVQGRTSFRILHRTRDRRALTDAEELHGSAADALTEIGVRHRRLTVETIDGLPAGDHPLGAILLESGFAISLKGLAYRGPTRRQPARR